MIASGCIITTSIFAHVLVHDYSTSIFGHVIVHDTVLSYLVMQWSMTQQTNKSRLQQRSGL